MALKTEVSEPSYLFVSGTQNRGCVSEIETTLQPIGLVVQAALLVVDGSGAHLYAEVFSDVKVGELCVNIGIDYGDEIYSDETEYAQVSLAAIVVFAILEYAFEIVLIPFDIVTWRQKVLITCCVGVIIHDVEVGLRVVAIHLIVPIEGIRTAEEASIDDGKLPIFVVVYLSASREDQCTPCSLGRVGGEGGQALLACLAAVVSCPGSCYLRGVRVL